MGPKHNRDASDRRSSYPIVGGMGVSFDMGSFVSGYCPDFWVYTFIGDPSDEYQKVYELVTVAQAAGIAAVKPDLLASEVHKATRDVIIERRSVGGGSGAGRVR